MTTALATVTTTNIQPIISLVTNAVTSDHTRRAYGRALTEFLTWFQASGASGLNKATVAAHIAHLRDNGTPASSINQRLTAIRKLGQEAADNGLIDQSTAQAISRVEGIHTDGKRLGNWLSKQDAQRLLATRLCWLSYWVVGCAVKKLPVSPSPTCSSVKGVGWWLTWWASATRPVPYPCRHGQRLPSMDGARQWASRPVSSFGHCAAAVTSNRAQ